jgi:hypothetical protein
LELQWDPSIDAKKLAVIVNELTHRLDSLHPLSQYSRATAAL